MFSTYFKETKTFPLKVLFNSGKTGEYLTFRTLNKLKGYKKFIFNAHIPFDNLKSAEIDIIMLHTSGIYIIEVKNYHGWIFGSETKEKWTQSFPNGQKYAFYNPIKQNVTHINCLKHYLNDNSNYFYSYIVFSNECELKNIRTNSNAFVLNRRDILSNIDDKRTVLNKEKIDFIYNKLKKLEH